MNVPADIVTAQATADHYAAAHDRIARLVQDLSAEQAATPVPGTPRWTVHDLVAHLAAIPSDIAAGRLTGIPTPEETQAQVDARRAVPIPGLLAEWEAAAPPIVELAAAGVVPPPLAVDAITHEQDLRGAVRAGRVENDDALRFATAGYVLGLTRRLAAAGRAPLRLRDPARGFDATAGGGEPGATVCAPEFELFRALAGRRSREQVAAYEWEGDVDAYLDLICVFGPLPAADVIEP